MIPQAGGLYVYIREAFGKLPAFLFGWQFCIFGRPGSTGALAVICVDSIAKAFELRPTSLTTLVSTWLLLFGLAAINVRGVQWGGWTQLITTVIKSSFVVFVALLPFLADAIWGGGHVDFTLYSQRETPNDNSTVVQISAVMLAVMWAYNGWEGVVPVAEEIRDPNRNIPLALLGGIGILACLYVGANFAYYAVMPMSEMALPENRQHVAELVVVRILGKVGGAVMSVGIAISALGAINSNLLTSPRVAFAMGRDGLLFKRFGQVHPRYGTPAEAIYLQAFLAAVLILLSVGLVQWLSYFREKTVFDLLTNSVIFVGSLFYMLAVSAVIVLRIRQPDRHRPYRMVGYPWVPIIYLLVYVWFVVNVFRSNPFEALAGLVILAAGVPFYQAMVRKRSAITQ